MNNKKRGAFLKKAREAKKLTQEELGNLIYYSDKTISAWEKGIYTPSDYETIIQLSKVLDISPLAILYGEDNTTEEEQLYSYLNYHKQTRLQIIILTIVFLLTLITILIAFYFTNLRDTTSIYTITTDREDIIIDDSFYLHSKGTSIISLNKIEIADYKYYINKIELYYLDNNKRIRIVSGPNDDIYLENNNRINEYNIKDLVKKDLYLSIYTDNNKEIKTPLYLNKRKNILSEKPINRVITKKQKVLETIGFIYQEGEYVYQKDNITIRYNERGTLNIVKENKDNNEYLYKRVMDSNIIYKRINKNGKYIEKEINTKEKSTCNISQEKDINHLAQCLNYLSEELK